MTEHIVIVGGGIIGCSTAYYLSETQSYKQGSIRVTLVEANSIAAAASGYSGGFLARDWHASETAALGRLSFQCHQDLSSQFDGHANWGYSPTISLSLAAREDADDVSIGKGESDWLNGIGGIRTRAGLKKDIDGAVPEAFDWINARHITGLSELDSETAQINPLKMTQFLSKECSRRGVDIVIGTVTSVVETEGRISAITLQDDRTIACDKLALTAGPWTGRLHNLLFPTLPRLPISSFAGTSLLLQTDKTTLSQYAAFGAITMADGKATEIEVFGREDGQIWIGGINDYSTLPDASASIEPEAVNVDKLTRISRLLFPDAKVSRVSKCYRPINSSSTHKKDIPVMKQVRQGVYVCAGHSVWGITLGPGSGLVMSRLLTNQEAGCDIPALHI